MRCGYDQEVYEKPSSTRCPEKATDYFILIVSKQYKECASVPWPCVTIVVFHYLRDYGGPDFVGDFSRQVERMEHLFSSRGQDARL